MHGGERYHRPDLPAHLTNAALSRDWLHHHASDWRPNTIKLRRNTLRQFELFIHPTPLIHATEQDVVAWRDSWGGSKPTIKSDSLAGYLSCLRSFYAYVVLVRRLRADDPVRPVPLPRRPRYGRERRYKAIREPELDRLEQAAERDPQLRAWIKLMAYAGMRVSDLAWMHIDDIADRGGGGGWAHLTGKGGVQRDVPLDAETMQALRPFLHGSGDRHVFLRPRSRKPWPPAEITRKISERMRSLGIKRPPHSLRHRFATEYATVDPDPRNLQLILGHADLATTMIYTHINPEACARGVDELARRTDHQRRASSVNADALARQPPNHPQRPRLRVVRPGDPQ